jgi:hypothetical protein
MTTATRKWDGRASAYAETFAGAVLATAFLS